MLVRVPARFLSLVDTASPPTRGAGAIETSYRTLSPSTEMARETANTDGGNTDSATGACEGSKCKIPRRTFCRADSRAW